VEVRDLEQARAGRIFPCLNEHHYTGCVGFDACTVLCWTSRPQERKALMVVGRAVEAVPCRDCFWARPVQGAVALLNGGQVTLMECRLGFWHGRTTLPDFKENKIALNVRLPCPGFSLANEDLDEADLPAPPHRQHVPTHKEQQKMSVERREVEHDLTSHLRPTSSDLQRIENRRRVREFLRVTPREEPHNRLTLLAAGEEEPPLVVTRAQLTEAIERLRPQYHKIIVLSMEQRRSRQEVREALHGISERTLERAQAAGLDTIIESCTPAFNAGACEERLRSS
jgi:hypothetical protein